MKFRYLRLTSLVTAFLFSSNILAFSTPPEPPHLEAPIAGLAFEIPETLGTICERYQVPDSPDPSPLIIHIQDAHGNYEAQKNIEALLHYLNQKYNIRLLFLEGAASKLDPDLFRFFENPDLNLKVADILTRTGEFSGAETFLLSAPRNVSAYGIEDIPTYRKDLELFRKVLKEGNRAQTFLNRLQAQIQSEEARLTSRDLKDFARAWKRERKNPGSLSSFIEVLNKYALKHLGLDLRHPKNQLRFPALLRMLKLKDLEKRMQLEKALQEKDKIIQSLNLEALKNIEKEKSPRLLLEKIHSEFGERFQPDAFPNFTLYVRYLAFKSEIEAEELFREIDSLGRELFERLARTPEEQKFVRSIQNLDVLEKLLKLELSRSDYSKIGQIGEAVRELPILDDALAFYRLAEERENHFLSKITSRMTDQKASRAILITGGFHSEGMKERFRKRGISFVEIRPRITSADESQQIYRQALLGEAQSDTFEKSQIAYVAQLIPYLEQSQMGANPLIRRNHNLNAAASLGQIRNFPEVPGTSLGLKAEREQAWEQHFREEGKFNEDEIPSLARLMTQMSSPHLFLSPEERERISLNEILAARQSFSALAGGQDHHGRRIPGTHDILSRLNASKEPVRFLERLRASLEAGAHNLRAIKDEDGRYPYAKLYVFLETHPRVFDKILDRAAAASLGEIEDAEKFLTEQKINFDPRFNHRVQQLLKIQRADWGSGEWAEYKRLRSDAQKAYDWMTGWIRKSPYYETLKGHPPVLLSMEGVVSAVEEGEGPRLTSFAGGLGILFGEWIRAIAYLGGVTTFDSKSEAPEFTIFLPDYGGGTAVSEVHSFGYPNLDAHNVQRPQNYGIGLFQDPRYPDENFLVEIPMYQEGKMIEVTVGFRCVRVGSLQVIMPTTDLEKNHPSVRGIFHQLYQGRSSSQERFKQEWILGLAAYKLRRKLDIPNGPIHLNETATFPYLVAAVRGYMEEGFTYDEALEWVGSKTIFFTHTFVHDGIDRFMDHEVPLGHYIRLYFEQSGNPEVSKQAGKVANWMIHGRKSTQDGILLPGFEQTFSRGVFSPLHFIVKLVYTFNGSVVAVSQLNAIKAGEFFVDQGILTREELAQKPVIGITNGVDHLYWMIPKIAARMNWHEPSPAKRKPEAILDPQDPLAKEIYRILHPHAEDLPPYLEKGRTPRLPDPELRNILRTYKEKAIRMIRKKVREQYIRETSRIEDRLVKGEAVAVELERLHALRVRWARWIGQENAEEWVKSWEAKPAEEQKPFRKELNEKEWVKLLDPDLFLGVWARRIVKYKRMLFTVFGKYMPEIESRLSADRALSPSDMDVLIKEMKNKNAFGEFIDLVVGKKMQLIFAGKTFSEDGRSNVALLHRIIERLSEEYPEIQDRVLFLEGYDETESQFLVRAADVWLNTPKRPLEASGTSGMKVSKMNVFASPNGDGWAAGGIRDGLNGRAKPIPLINQDHPDVWPRSGGPKDERPEEAKQAKSPEAYYFETEANNFFGMLREEAERYYSQSPEWLRAIRRWIYFTALVYDIRGEFTGRYVPSFSDIPGGQEKGIFELYADAVRKESEARQRIEKRRQAQAATAESLGFYERNPASILHVARTLFENVLWLPEADQTVYMWYMEQLDLEGKPAGARKLDPAVRVFNQSVSPFLEALGLNKETANTRLPLIISEGLIASKREEADKIARQISNIMRPGDLFLAIWNGREKSPVIQKLYRESGGRFKVRDLPVHMASNPRITQIIKPLQTPPVYISALSESGELELTLREGDRIKLNMNQLLKKGIDPLQVMRLVRQLADYPKLRKDRFTKAGFEFIKEGGYWEVGNHFVERIHEIYASHTTRQITLRAA